MEGFNLFHKYLAKHHPKLDFSKLDMEEMEREILANRPSEATSENVEAMEGVATTALADLCLLLTFLRAFSPFLLNKNTVPWTHYFEHVYILASWKQYFWAHLFWACLFTLILCFMLGA